MDDVTVYNAAKVSISWAGHSFTGLGSGDDAIKVSRRGDGVQLDIGMQGDGTFSQSTDKSGTITVRLLAGSETNKFLSLKAAASEAGALFSAPMIISEAGTDNKTAAMRTVIQKVPDMNRGAKAGEVEWTFLSPVVIINHSDSEVI